MSSASKPTVLRVEGLKVAFHEAVDDYIETCGKTGRTPEKPYSGQIMVIRPFTPRPPWPRS